jgi:hypothetical protein
VYGCACAGVHGGRGDGRARALPAPDGAGRGAHAPRGARRGREGVPPPAARTKGLQFYVLFPIPMKSKESMRSSISPRSVGFGVRSRKLSNVGYVTKNLLYQAPPCFGRHVMPVVPAAFAVVSTHRCTLGPRGRLWLVLLMCDYT